MKKILFIALIGSTFISNAQNASFPQMLNYQLKNPSNSTYSSFTYVPDTITTTHVADPGSTTYFVIKPTTPSGTLNADNYRGLLSMGLALTRCTSGDTINTFIIAVEGSNDGASPAAASKWFPITCDFGAVAVTNVSGVVTTTSTASFSAVTDATALSGLITNVNISVLIKDAGYLHYRFKVHMVYGSTVAAVGYATWKRNYFGQNN